jgi:hypothetical protein
VNSSVSAPLDNEVVTASLHAYENVATQRCTAIMTRMEWCQQNKIKARTEAEVDEWCAEEEGLRDALLHRDCVSKYQYCSESLRTRYQLGLEDGQTLLRVALIEALWQPAT